MSKFLTVVGILCFSVLAQARAPLCAQIFVQKNQSVFEALVTEGSAWAKIPYSQRSKVSALEMSLTQKHSGITWNAETHLADVLRHLNFKRIATSNGEGGTSIGIRGERAGVLFIEGEMTKTELLAKFRNNLGVRDFMGYSEIPRISVLMSPRDLNQHLDAIIDLAQNWGAAGIVLRKNYQIEILFETEQMVGPFPGLLSDYLKQKNIPTFAIPFKERRTAINVFYSELDGGIALQKLSGLLKQMDLVACSKNIQACLDRLHSDASHYLGAKLETSRLNQKKQTHSPEALKHRLDQTPLPAEFSEQVLKLDQFPVRYKTQALRATRYIMGLHQMKDRQSPKDLDVWPEDPEIKTIAVKVNQALNSPYELSKFILKLFIETGLEMNKDAAMGKALEAGSLPREAAYRVLGRWHREIGFNDFGNLGAQFATSSRFREVLSRGGFIDHGFEHGSISHGIDVHAFQIIFVGQTLRAQGTTNFKDFIEYVSASDKNLEVWNELFDNPKSRVGRLTSPEQITEIYSKFTGLR